MQTDHGVREKLFTMRMSSEEWQRVEAIAAHLGLNAANLIRMLVIEKARALGLEAATLPIAPSSRPRAIKTKPPAKKR